MLGRVSTLLKPVSAQAVRMLIATPYVYRGDYRSFEQIKATNGLIAGDPTQLSLKYHVHKPEVRTLEGFIKKPVEYLPSGYISTTLSPDLANDFAFEANGYAGMVYQFLRSRIVVAPFVDVAKKDKLYPAQACGIASEAEMAVPEKIPLSDMVAYRQIFLPWQINPHFNPSEFSIMIRSACDKEAEELNEDFLYSYPSYADAKAAANALDDAIKQYTGHPKAMLYFEKLTGNEVKLSGDALVEHYVKTYHAAQKELGRPRAQFYVAGSPTLFAAPLVKTYVEAVAESLLRPELKR